MAKEKRRLIDEKAQEETLFYYEIIGSIAIILSITALAKLGKIGSILTLLFKVSFGDWYWFFILFFLFIGFYSLFVHERFDFSNHRFIGFLFVSLAFLMYSHFPIHKYINSLNNNYFSETWAIYRSFINTGSSETLGGGMIGAGLFYLMFYLLGDIGVILLGLVLIILGVSLIFNRSLKDIFSLIFRGFRNIGKYLLSFNRFFRYEVGKDIKKSSTSFLFYNVSIPIRTLSDNNNEDIYHKINMKKIEISQKIINIFKDNHLEINEKEIIISYIYTIYTYYFLNTLNINVVLNKVKEEFTDVYIELSENILKVIIKNNEKMTLNLKELIMNSDNFNSDYVYLIGKNIYNETFEIDVSKQNSIMLVGEASSGIRNFVYTLIIQSLIRQSLKNYEFYLYDSLNSFSSLKYLFTTDNNIIDFLSNIKEIIDNRLSTIKEYNVNNYLEYVKKKEMEEVKNDLPFSFVIINELFKADINVKNFESRLLYISQLAKKVGMFIIYIVREKELVNNLINSMFDIKLIFKCPEEISDKIISKSIVNNPLFDVNALQESGECLYINKSEKDVLLTGLITKNELNKIDKIIQKKE